MAKRLRPGQAIRLTVAVTWAYNRGMQNRPLLPLVQLLAGTVAYVAIVLVAFWMLGGEARRLLGTVLLCLIGLISLPFGAAVTWSIVRWFNRHHEREPCQRPVAPP
ncbi:MAG: hypothetical protein JSS02_13855 [Planctomycetes bacterium]|nr:hypothetical protein [Planctomycetota bacterium]